MLDPTFAIPARTAFAFPVRSGMLAGGDTVFRQQEISLARKPVTERNEEQRVRQADLRRRNREKRRPTRDDVARALLWKAIDDIRTDEHWKHWEKLHDAILAILVDQGFDERESDMVIDDIVARNRGGRGGFRRKTHLVAKPDEQ